MKQISPHISIHQSRLWETNTGIVHGPKGTLLIDPGIFPDELASIALAGGRIAAGFATHAHWDHVLWHRDLGIDVPRFASAETVAWLQQDPDRIRRNLTNTETQIGEGTLWDRSLLFAERPMPWGQGSIAGIACELIPVPGHADGQAALLLPEHAVCFVAGTLSDIEVPSVSEGSQSIAIYLQTLDRLQEVFDRVKWIVPGHGSPADCEEAQHRLDADRRYLQAIGSAVNVAGSGEGADGIARRVLCQLDERRASSDLAASMHLENIEQLVAERERRESDLPIRRSSRLILLDADYRVWMLRLNDPVRPRWILPGGGVEEGESWEDAARRELWEECAIKDVEVGPLVAKRNRDGIFNDSWHHAEERYYIAQLHGQVPHTGNMFAYERDDYTSQVWFSADELRACYEQAYPIGLADLLDLLQRGEFPAQPWVWAD